MFASRFVSPRSSSRVRRALKAFCCLASGLIALAGAAPATAAPALCKPALTFRQVSFSPIDYETMQRRWSATLSVDASSCATASGQFEILFALWSETAPDDDLIRAFTWTPGLTAVAVDVTANEAIGRYWLQNVATCPCRE
jgi:hypothetical protein